MSHCRFGTSDLCDQPGESICFGGKDLVSWVCSKHRSWCDCRKCQGYRAEHKRDGTLDTSYKQVVLCPHCGEVCQDEYESNFWGDAHKGDTFEVTCYARDCGKTFNVEPHVSIKFSTYAKGED